MINTRSLVIVCVYALSLTCFVPHAHRASVIWEICAAFTFYLGFIRPLRHELRPAGTNDHEQGSK